MSLKVNAANLDTAFVTEKIGREGENLTVLRMITVEGNILLASLFTYIFLPNIYPYH